MIPVMSTVDILKPASASLQIGVHHDPAPVPDGDPGFPPEPPAGRDGAFNPPLASLRATIGNVAISLWYPVTTRPTTVRLLQSLRSFAMTRWAVRS